MSSLRPAARAKWKPKQATHSLLSHSPDQRATLEAETLYAGSDLRGGKLFRHSGRDDPTLRERRLELCDATGRHLRVAQVEFFEVSQRCQVRDSFVGNRTLGQGQAIQFLQAGQFYQKEVCEPRAAKPQFVELSEVLQVHQARSSNRVSIEDKLAQRRETPQRFESGIRDPRVRKVEFAQPKERFEALEIRVFDRASRQVEGNQPLQPRICNCRQKFVEIGSRSDPAHSTDLK